MTSGPTLALYGHPFSSYTWKALIALYANGTVFEFREIDQSVPKFESFTGKAHPSGQFPVLTDGDAIVVETSSIVEHLALHHPGPAPLVPADPAEAVVARMLDRVFDHYVMGNMQRVIAAYFVNKDDPAAGGLRDEPFGPEIEAGKAGLRRAYAWLEGVLDGRQWAAGDRFSLADCGAGPFLFYADWTHPIGEAFPRVRAYRQRLLRRAAFARAVDEARPYRPFFPLGAPDRD